MSKSHFVYPPLPLAQYADKVLALELFWPFPLIIIGILRILEPLLVGAGIGLVLLPWLARGLILGRPSRPTFVGGALALLGISGLIGVWVSYDSTLSWPMVLTMAGSISLFFAVVNTGFSPRWLGGTLVLAGGLLAFYFVGQYGYFYYPYEDGLLPRLGRFTGSLLPRLVIYSLHPNAVAGFLASVWLLSLVLIRQTRGGKRAVWVLAAGIISYGLLISESRGAWLGLAAAAGIWTWLIIPRPNLRLALGGMGLLGATLILLGLVSVIPGESRIPFLSPTLDTAYSRLTLYRNSLNLWGDYLFTGIGLGDTFAFVYSRYQLLIPYRYLSYAHNLFLEVGLSLGLLGLAALIWLLISFYRFVIKVETKGNLNSHSLAFFRAAWLGVTANFIHGLTDAPQFAGSGWTMPMLFAMLGLVVAAGYPALMKGKANKEADAAPIAPHRWRWGVRAGIGVALVLTALIFWRPLLTGWYANMGAIHQTRAELAPHLDNSARQAEITLAEDYFTRALSLNPTQVVAHRRLGLIALDQGNFEIAAHHLEQAYSHELPNQATHKALGYAYLWSGRLDEAELLFRQLDDPDELIEELRNLSKSQKNNGQIKLSQYAHDMSQRLKVTS